MDSAGASFYRGLPDSVEVDGKAYALTPAFDNVLNLYECMDGCDTAGKMELMAYYLLRDPCDDPAVIAAAAKAIFPAPTDHGETAKCFDFLQDGAYIYAAFMQAYGIDLVEERGWLHWWKFNALLQGLPSGTKFSEIVKIRLQPMPPATKHNAAERAELARLKSVFALKKSETERQKDLQDGLKMMAAALISMAKGKEECPTEKSPMT